MSLPGLVGGVYRRRMMNQSFAKLVMVSAFALVAGVAGCVAEEETTQAPAPVEQPALAEQSQLLTCTPGYKMCDFSCYYVGGPSSNDCIVRCNTAGTGWVRAQDCGWAQNFPYSSSCLDRPQGPICQNN